jgi:heat shock protein HslJ
MLRTHQNGYIKIILLVVLLLGATLFLLNFNKSKVIIVNTPTSENIITEEPTQVTSIYTSWEWISTTDHQGTVTTPLNPKDFILTISKERRLSSSTDCNSISGSIIIQEEALSVGPLVSTKMACVGETLENKYSYDLSRAVSYTIEDDILSITLLQDTGVMQFKKTQ